MLEILSIIIDFHRQPVHLFSEFKGTIYFLYITSYWMSNKFKSGVCVWSDSQEHRPALRGSRQPGSASADRQEAPCQGGLERDPGDMERASKASAAPLLYLRSAHSRKHGGSLLSLHLIFLILKTSLAAIMPVLSSSPHYPEG